MITVIVLVIGSVLFIHRNMERRPVIAVRFGPSSELTLSTTVVDLGATNSTATITLSNTGSNPLAWHATPADPWLKVSPPSGSLAGGSSQQLTVTAERDVLPEGDGRTQLKVSSADDQSQGAIAVALREERPPAITNARASNTRIGGYGCPTTSEISAKVKDESGPIRVMLVSPGRQNQPMQANGDTFTAKLGSGSGANIVWRIVATDARNNTATSPAQVIVNADCAVRPPPPPKTTAPSVPPSSTQIKPSDSADAPTTKPGRGSSDNNGDSGSSGSNDSGSNDNGSSGSGSSGGQNDSNGDSGGFDPFGG